MENRPVGAELFRADGRTDGKTDKTKLTIAFSNFANAPKIGGAVQVHVCKHKTAHV